MGFTLPTNRNVYPLPWFFDEALCQGHPFRLSFDVTTVVNALRYHRFDFPFWDPIHDNITISRIVDLTENYEDLVSVAREVCKEYTHGELGEIDPTASIRCLTPTLLTLRLTKLHAISLVSRQFDFYPYDEELYGLIVGYEGLGKGTDRQAQEAMIMKVDNSYDPIHHGPHFTNHEAIQEPLTVCIIGSPTAQNVLPVFLVISSSK